MHGGPVVVCYYRKLGRYALNVLAGALESDADTASVPILFPKTAETLASTLSAVLAEGAQPLVLWSFYSPQCVEIQRTLAQVRAMVADARVIHLAGGVHATAEPEHTLDMGFDYVAVGEGERLIQETVRCLQHGQPLIQIRGLVSHRTRGAVSRNRAQPVCLDDYASGSRFYHKYSPIEITRGCIYACRFCQTPHINKARFRHRSIGHVVTEVSWLRADGFRDIRFISPSALSYGAVGEEVNHERLEALLAGVRDVMGNQGRIFYGTFPSEVRPEHVTPQSLEILRRYVDNDNLVIGGQSGSQRVLDHMRRGHTVQHIRRAVELSLAYGFRPNVDFLFGVPGETFEDVEISVDFARELAAIGARLHVHSFMPLPGTPFSGKSATTLTEPQQQILRNLVARGSAYGQWQAQQEIARELLEGGGE